MRQDLNKQLTERERVRSGLKHHYVRGKKEDTGKKRLGVQAWPFIGESTSPFPFKEGIKKPYGHNTKSFNENLNPLYGFLRQSVGKNWDKVFSQLSKTFDVRSVINKHILVHLFRTVEINTFMEKGKVCYINTSDYSGGDKGIDAIENSHVDFYVDPVTKILLTNRNKVSTKQHNAKVKKELETEKSRHLLLLSQFSNQNGTGARYAIKINDVWYEISVIKNAESVKCRRTNSKGEVEYYTHYPEINSISIHGAKFVPTELIEERLGRSHVSNSKFHVSRKIQLNSAQIKKLGLNKA